jgi:hypothetical protein
VWERESNRINGERNREGDVVREKERGRQRERERDTEIQ